MGMANSYGQSMHVFSANMSTGLKRDPAISIAAANMSLPDCNATK